MSLSKQLFFSGLLGIISGLICWIGLKQLPEGSIIFDIYPGAILGIFIFLANHYITGLHAKYPWLAFVVIFLGTAMAWRLSYLVGTKGSLPFEVPHFMAAGLVGGFFVAVAIVLAWRLFAGFLPIIVWIALSGGIGGAVFILIDKLIDESNEIWVLLLFVEWQLILMLGVASTLFFYRHMRES